MKLFVLTRLTGKAQECVRKNPTSVDEIITDLEKYIKPDNSKIKEGRMQSLRFNSNRVQEFTQQTEKLAEALQRTLIIEGISQEKAKEMTVDRTVDMYRQTAHTDFVETAIASTTFAIPKDVLAKFVIENSKEKQEKQILAIRQNSRTYQNRNPNGRGRGNFNGKRRFNNYNQNNSYGNNQRNFQRNNRNFQQN